MRDAGCTARWAIRRSKQGEGQQRAARSRPVKGGTGLPACPSTTSPFRLLLAHTTPLTVAIHAATSSAELTMPVPAPLSPVTDDTDDSIDTADIERVVKSLSRRSPVPRSHFDPPTAAFLANRGRVVTLGTSLLPRYPVLTSHLGMFIIDLFEVTDPAGNRVPGGDEAVSHASTIALVKLTLAPDRRRRHLRRDGRAPLPPALARRLHRGQGARLPARV